MREVLLCPANDIPRLGSKVFMVNGISIAVFRSRDKFYAIENVCAHMGGPVGEGFLDGEGKNISCPWHGHSFNIKTGVSMFGDGKIRTFPVTKRDGKLIVQIE